MVIGQIDSFVHYCFLDCSVHSGFEGFDRFACLLLQLVAANYFCCTQQIRAFRLRDRIKEDAKYDSCPVRIFLAASLFADQFRQLAHL
jgi:hypothetical protein